MKKQTIIKSISASDLDKSSKQPAYQQLAALLKAQIANESWPPGHKIPPEQVLAKQTGLSVLTVRQAIAQLVEGGLLAREQGRGTFVVGLGWNHIVFSMTSLTKLMGQKDRVKIRILKMCMEKLDQDQVLSLEMEPGYRTIAIQPHRQVIRVHAVYDNVNNITEIIVFQRIRIGIHFPEQKPGGFSCRQRL